MFRGSSPEQMLSSKKKDGKLREWQHTMQGYRFIVAVAQLLLG